MRHFLLLALLLLPPTAGAAELKLSTWNLEWLTARPKGDAQLPPDVRVASGALGTEAEHIPKLPDEGLLGPNHVRTDDSVAKRDQPVRAEDALDLGQRPLWIWDVEEHRLGEHDVEGVVGEGECEDVALTK